MSSRALSGVALAVVLVACGAARIYVPRQQNIHLDKLPGLNTRELVLVPTVFIAAGETSKTSVVIAEYVHGYTWSASEATLTGSVIEHVETELEKRGVRIDPSADTRLMIAITHPRIRLSSFTGGCYVDVIVQTGDDERFEFEATKISGLSIAHCWDGVLAHAAIAVLETDGVLEYLSQSTVHESDLPPIPFERRSDP